MKLKKWLMILMALALMAGCAIPAAAEEMPADPELNAADALTEDETAEAGDIVAEEVESIPAGVIFEEVVLTLGDEPGEEEPLAPAARPEAPAAEEMPIDDDAAPTDDEAPAVDQTPVDDDVTPADDEAPTVDQTPIGDDVTPTDDEAPTVDQTPADDDVTSTTDEAPAAEETPSGDETDDIVPAILAEDNAEDDEEIYVYDCPDVCDMGNVVKASKRVYPGLLIWPLKGRQPLTHVTSHVGWRNAGRIHAAQGGTWPSWLHHGVDVGGVDTNQVVVAAASGIAYADATGGSGNYVVIDHGNGWYTKYQHLSRFAGDMYCGAREVPVTAGDAIGYVGSSGGDYPVHFHFEIAWSPDGPGSDDRDYQRETHNRSLRAYSFPQESVVTLHWASTWEICSAENQHYYGDGRHFPGQN